MGQGPRLITRRRNHGCSHVDLVGSHGIMVAGGYNSNGGLTSVEFLELGKTSDDISFNNVKWKNLTPLKQPRPNKVMLINDRSFVFIYIRIIPFFLQQIC